MKQILKKIILECALFSSTAVLVIYPIFISWQIQAKPLSCERFHKAEMEPVISATRREKLTKTPRIMSRWVIIRRRMLRHLRWEGINKCFHTAVTLFHKDGCYLSPPLPLGVPGGLPGHNDAPRWVLNEDHWSAFAARLSPCLWKLSFIASVNNRLSW